MTQYTVSHYKLGKKSRFNLYIQTTLVGNISVKAGFKSRVQVLKYIDKHITDNFVINWRIEYV